jgi:hypothetical protein
MFGKINQNTQICEWFYRITAYDFEGFHTTFFVKRVSLRHRRLRVLNMMTDIKLAGKQHTSPLPLFENKASIYAIYFTQ